MNIKGINLSSIKNISKPHSRQKKVSDTSINVQKFDLKNVASSMPDINSEIEKAKSKLSSLGTFK